MSTTIELKSISCKGVKSLVLFQKPSLYAVVSAAAAASQKTPVDRDGGENPDWDHPLSLEIDAGDRDLVLEFRLKAEGMILLGGDRLVGKVRIPISDIDLSGTLRHVSYQVRTPDGKPNGTLNFSYRVNAPALSPPPPPVAQAAGFYPPPQAPPHSARFYPDLTLDPVISYPPPAPAAGYYPAPVSYPPPAPPGGCYPPPEAATSYPPPAGGYYRDLAAPATGFYPPVTTPFYPPLPAAGGYYPPPGYAAYPERPAPACCYPSAPESEPHGYRGESWDRGLYGYN